MDERSEAIASLKTRNGIKVGDKVIYVGPSKTFPRQNLLASAKLRGNVMYEVSWIFMGEDFEQVELKEFPDDAWVHDLLLRVPNQ